MLSVSSSFLSQFSIERLTMYVFLPNEPAFDEKQVYKLQSFSWFIAL